MGTSGITLAPSACRPDDGTTRTWFSVLTETTVELRALDYDWTAAAAAMDAAGLAGGYARALRTGIWPSADVLPPGERARRGLALQPGTSGW